MAIPISTLQNASGRYRAKAASLSEARNLSLRTAFLCHSHLDATLAKGIIAMLAESGLNVYVDWADTTMPDTPNRVTAEKIKLKIKSVDFFFFLATSNSMKSRWCPWEIGYADGTRRIDSILIIPTSDNTGAWHGSEYLQLYRRIDFTVQGNLAFWDPGASSGTFMRNL